MGGHKDRISYNSLFCRLIYANLTETNPEERVMKILHQLQLEFKQDDIKGLSKLVVMVGDLSKPRLGLSTDNYTTLCERVDTIIHNGATVNSVLPYEGNSIIMQFCSYTYFFFVHV